MALENKKISHAAVSDFTIEWQIPVMEATADSRFVVGRDFPSPPIECLGAKRRIHLQKSGNNICIFIWKTKKDGTLDVPFAYYTIGIKETDETVYKSVSGKLNYEKKDEPYSIEEFLHVSDLVRDSSQIVRDGNIVAFCTISLMDHREIFKMNVATQTENFSGTSKLVQDFKDLYLGEKNCDTTIKVADREFRAHRLILGARSTVFCSMYSHDTTERKTGFVEIEDCDPEVFQEFLIFLYTGTLQSLSSENASGLYSVADKYDVQDVKKECLKFMESNLSVANICENLTLALKYNESELLKLATDFYVENAKAISKTAKWLSFHKDHPVESNELYLKALEHYIPD